LHEPASGVALLHPRSRGGPGTRGAPGRGAGALVSGAGGVAPRRRAVHADSFGRLTGGGVGHGWAPRHVRAVLHDCRRMGLTVSFGRGDVRGCVWCIGPPGSPASRDPAARHVSVRPAARLPPVCAFTIVTQNEATTWCHGGVPPVASRLAALRSLTRSLHNCGALLPRIRPARW